MADRKKRALSSRSKKSEISGMDLMSREEEYKRLNRELEAKTANLVREAEEVMRGPDTIPSQPSMLANINADDFLNNYDDNEEEVEDLTLDFQDRDDDREYDVPKQTSSHANLSSRGVSGRRPPTQQNSARSNNVRPQSISSARKSARSKATTQRSKSSAANVSVDNKLLGSDGDFSFQKAIDTIEGRIDRGEVVEEVDDVLPSAAAEMGEEAQIRFLKAKLRVMQEEVDILSEESSKKDEALQKATSRLKEVEEERNRLSRTSSSQQQQIDKHRRMADDAKGKAESLDSQMAALKKELEAIKRSQKKQTSEQSASEVRLNRAQEEVEKYKSLLQKEKSSSKEVADNEKRKMEQLLAENKRLEKQKNELMTGFKKQLKLIDILKRQKMHIEAAKMLNFTEEEFVKALEWGN